MVKLQRADLGVIQCTFVPDLSIDGDLDFIRFQRIRLILIKLDSSIGKWPMGIEDQMAVRKR